MHIFFVDPVGPGPFKPRPYLGHGLIYARGLDQGGGTGTAVLREDGNLKNDAMEATRSHHIINEAKLSKISTFKGDVASSPLVISTKPSNCVYLMIYAIWVQLLGEIQ